MAPELHQVRRRVAFVGQSTFFRACVPPEQGEHLETTFIEFREGKDPSEMRAALDRLAPDAVVLFRPEVVPPGTLADVAVPVVGFLTEPVPRTLTGRPHPDLAKRGRDLERLDPANIDRLVSFDPLIAPVAERVFPIWRSLAIPVADRLFREPAPLRVDPLRMVFVGRSTPHRETYLAPVKASYDLLHVAFGAGIDELDGLLRDHDVTLNLHNEPYPSFENRVCLHLAAGHLVISEPLDPRHGLEPGRDYVEVVGPDDLLRALRDAEADPERADAVRASGRAQAERFRASTVFGELIEDLLADTEVSGTQRAAAPPAAPEAPASRTGAP
jgi:glycosyl transferase family 1